MLGIMKFVYLFSLFEILDQVINLSKNEVSH